MSWATGGVIICLTWVGPATPSRRAPSPIDVGVEHADLLARGGQRGGQVDRHRRLADPALAAGDRVHLGERGRLGERICAPPATELGLSSRRCSSLITSRSTATPVTPGTAATTAVMSRVMVSAAAAGESDCTFNPDPAIRGDIDVLDHAQVVIGRRISGWLTRASASVNCSAVGGGVRADGLMASCYVARGPKSSVGVTR